MQKDVAIGIWESGTRAARTFECRVAVEGEEVMTRRLTPTETAEAREISAQYVSLYASGKKGSKSYLHLLGGSLLRLFLQSGWQDLEPKIISRGRLIVVSRIPEVLQLPWELLFLPGNETVFIGQSDRFSILRLPKDGSSLTDISSFLSSSAHELAGGPLRMLYLSADQQSFEDQELSLIQALEGVDIQLEVCESATIAELERRMERFKPHLVVLSGEGKVSGGVLSDEAHFILSDPSGKADMISAEGLASALKKGNPECIILGSGKGKNGPDPARELLCQRLAEHIPLTVAWNSPLSLSREFFRSLSSGTSLDQAVRSAAQKALGNSLQEAGEGTGEEALEAHPVLYATREPSALFDPNKTRVEMAVAHQELPSMPGMTAGYTEEFVDRRKELQRLSQALRQGAVHTLIITGPEGSGKSTLANYLARSFARLDHFILPLGATPHNPITSARLLESAAAQLAAKKEVALTAELKNLKNPALSVEKRLSALMGILKSNRILLFWDDLNLDGKTGRITDPLLGSFYQQMTRGLGLSRAIITAPNAPADVPILPSLALNWRLAALSKAAFMRFTLRNDIISEKYRRGEVTFDDLAGLLSLYEKDPAQLSQISRSLEKGLNLEGDHLAALKGTLGPESLAALFRSAVYNIAISPAGFAAAAGISEETAADNLSTWEDLSLSYRTDGDGLWAIFPSARQALLDELSPGELKEAQKAAAEFLRMMAESGRSQELYLSRLDCLQEARGHYIQAGDLLGAKEVTIGISGYLERRGYYSEVIRLNRELSELQPDADLMNWTARAYLAQSDLIEAARWYESALVVSSDPISHQGLGMALLAQGKYDQAYENLKKAREGFLAAADQEGEAASLQALASIDRAKGDRAAASEKLESASQILKDLGDRPGEAAILQEMAGLDMMEKDYDLARPRLERSLELLRASSDRAGEAVVLFNLAGIDQENGDLDRAEKELNGALAITRELADSKGMAASLHSLGMIFAQKGDIESAAARFREALEIYQELKDKSGEAGAFFQLGALAVQREKIQEGLRLMALSAVILRNIKSDEVKNIEPVVERLASQLGYSQEQFMAMLQEVMHSYVKDKGMGLVERAFRE